MSLSYKILPDSPNMACPTDLPLPTFLAHILGTLLPIFNDEVTQAAASSQATLAKAIDDLYLVARMITSLGLFSENEGVDELGDKELVFMAMGWLLGEAEGRTGLGGYDERASCLRRSDAAYTAFFQLLKTYGISSPEETSESEAMSEVPSRSTPRDPALKRDAKIRQYRREKELREQISMALPGTPDPSSNPLVFLLELLPSPIGHHRDSQTTVNPEAGAHQRRATLLLLRLLHTLALSSLSHNAMELELLASAPREYTSPSSSFTSAPPRSSGEDDNTWRLDRSASHYRPRELISGGGRVLRPFTILPSTSQLSDRERLKGEVFRNGHRLPTMTIDEYLDEEKRRGNVITGGGQASADAPTTSELLALGAENDGTMRGSEAAEQKRQKEEYWAQYGEQNKKGAGNTTNRG